MRDDEIIYLDNNATTQLDPVVVEEMLPFLTSYYGNPSSGYGFAAKARKAIDLAREQLAALLGCEPPEIVFTSGGENPDLPPLYRDQFPLSVRAQISWTKRRRRALRQTANAFSPINCGRRSGKRAPWWNRKCRVDCRTWKSG